MTLLVTILHILVCFVLIIVILVQGGRGQGLSGPSFSSGNVQSLFGTQAADFLTKATSVSAICFLFTCIGLNFMESRRSKSLLEGARQAAPVDIEAVKKALEKIQAEKGNTTSETAKKEVSSLLETAKTAVQATAADAGKVAEQTSAKITETAKSAEPKVAEAIQSVKTAVVDPIQKESPKS